MPAPTIVRGPAPVGIDRLDYVYRADTRSIGDLKNGFVPRYDRMSVNDLRELVRVYSGAKTLGQSSLSAHLKPGGVELESNDPNMRRSALDLHQYIIQKNPRGPWVSTDPDKACGGYAGGRSIYRIDMGKMKPVPWEKAVPGAKQAKLAPHLLMDGETVDSSSCFALHARVGATREVTFLGGIPREWITLM